MKARHWLKYNTLFFIEHFLGRPFFEKMFGRSEQKMLNKINQNLKEKTCDSTFRVIDLKKGEFTDPVIDRNCPVVFRGAAKDWECCKNWNFEFFKENYGDKIVTLQDNVGVVDKENPQPFSELKLSEYIDRLKQGSLEYLKFSRIVHDDSSLQQAFNLNWLQKFKSKFSFGEVYYMFIGGTKTKTPIHNGLPDTIFIQVEGKKKFIFYKPKDRLFLGVRPERRGYFYSNADPKKTNDPQFPLMKYAQKHEVILDPGDVLWFPSLVWHQVENVSHSIGIAYKFVDLRSALISSKMMTTLFFMATRPSIFRAFIANRTEKNDYIFTKNQSDLN